MSPKWGLWEGKIKKKPRQQGENYVKRAESRGKIIKKKKTDMKHRILAKNIKNFKKFKQIYSFRLTKWSFLPSKIGKSSHFYVLVNVF